MISTDFNSRKGFQHFKQGSAQLIIFTSSMGFEGLTSKTVTDPRNRRDFHLDPDNSYRVEDTLW
jgi:hypothetical protein